MIAKEKRVARQSNGWVDLARDAATGIETIRAHFDGHAYDPHFHDAYLIGLTEQGIQEFSCRRVLHRSTPGRIILIEPGDVHDGHAPEEAGFTYRMIYLDPLWMRRRHGDRLVERGAGAELGFRNILAEDAPLARAISRAFHLLHRGDIRLAQDTALDHLIDGLADRMFGRRTVAPAPNRMPIIPPDIGRVRDLLHARMSEEIGLDELAGAAGTDRFRLTRSFRAAFGLPPHAYLVQLRLVQARRLLARGEPPAAVAAAVGFADQSHLGRWFRRAYRLTPAAYRQICTNLPDGAVPGR